MTWLVTGGAGYIGSHVVHALLDADMPVVVIDDLSSGLEQFVPASVPFVRGNLLDERPGARHAAPPRRRRGDSYRRLTSTPGFR